MSVDPTRIDLQNDPLSKRFVGYAYHGNTPFDVPYISHIEGNLYTGGCEHGLILPAQIRHVISLYPWESYQYHENVDSVLAVKLYDSLDQAMEQVEEIALWVAGRLNDGPTLVHCQAGLNRSALVAGLALILNGYSADRAISLLREKRSPACLCNTAFEKYLREYERFS